MKNLNEHLSQNRINYDEGLLDLQHVLPNPLAEFKLWMASAIAANVPEPNAMCLSTVVNNKPSSRIVLLKGTEVDGFTFYTNYESKKASEILGNNHVCLNFFWQTMSRQVRIEGIISKVSDSESDEYFASRPRESQIGAWASKQSTVIQNRDFLDEQTLFFTEKFKGQIVPRPASWGGYIVKPQYVEFWQGRLNRLHDRLAYTLVNDEWKIERLSP
jgi:pyridoxamine 5'-phosphate oxidase